MGILLFFVFYYAAEKRDAFQQAFFSIGGVSITFATLFILIAKLALVENMRITCAKFSINVSFQDSFRIYNFTQLGKYVPGSIWHLVSRVSMLRDKGHSLSSIRDALIAENVALLLVACTLAAGSLMATIWTGLLRIDIGQESAFGLQYLAEPIVWLLCLLILLAGLMLWLFCRRHRNVLSWMKSLIPSLRTASVLLPAWLLLGTSLWITAVPFIESPGPYHYFYVVGLFSIAFVVGLLAPFAPGGLGVREYILVEGLTYLIAFDQAVVLSVTSRVLYFGSELLLGAFSAGLRKPGG